MQEESQKKTDIEGESALKVLISYFPYEEMSGKKFKPAKFELIFSSVSSYFNCVLSFISEPISLLE